MRDYGDWCRRPGDSSEGEWIHAAAGIAAFVGAILLLVYWK
jgi:hypothetical protein